MKKLIFFLLLFNLIFCQEVIVRGRTDTGVPKYLRMDNFSNTITNDYFKKAIRDGYVFTISKTFIDVPNDSSVYFRIKSNDKLAEFEIFTNLEAKAYLKTYANTTYTDTGTVYTPFNRLIGSTNTSSLTVTYDPTIDNIGDMRGDDLVGSTAPSAKAGGGSSDIVSMIMPNKEFLLRVENKSGQAQDINIIINIKEDE